MSEQRLQEVQWQDLYKELKALLAAHGEESPFGNGDYWLFDDNWGGAMQKVCVFNIAFLDRALATEIQRLLCKTPFQKWGVMFALELKNHGQPIPTISSDGIVV